VNGRFPLDPADLRPHIAGPALVFDDEVDTLHHYPVFAVVTLHLPVIAIDLVAVKHTMHRALHLPALAAGISGIPANDDFNCIALLNPFNVPHSTISS
jgi:hypothetical protein